MPQSRALFAALVLTVPLSSETASAGCPCAKRGGANAVPVSPIGDPYATGSPYGVNSYGASPYASGGYGMGPYGPAPYPTTPLQPVPRTPQLVDPWTGVSSVPSRPAPRADVAPPPGTIGQTYQMKSRPVPATMNPRTGMVDVRVRGASHVHVHSMNPFRHEDEIEGFQDIQDPNMWHFHTELIPGLSQIYRIEAHFSDTPDGEYEERYVRLIMGRVLEIDFDRT